MREDPKAGSVSVRKKLIVGIFVFFDIVLLVTFFFGKRGYTDIVRMRREYRTLEAEFRKLDETKKKLALEIAELERNPQAVEKEAREKLWLMKPDEKVIVIKKK
jgi:cell division protein FtsB